MSGASSDLATLLALAELRIKEVGAASAALLIYDHATSFGEEVDLFWTGPWTLSRVMYFGIRLTSLVLGLTVMTIGQAAITLRVWFLFFKTPIVQKFALTMFVLCISATYTSAGLLWGQATIIMQDLKSSQTLNLSSIFIWLFIPSLVLHSVLFALKVYRFITSPRYLQTDTLLWRFMKEGMFMYIFAMASILFSIISLTMTDIDDLPSYLAVWNGLAVVTTVVISVCRAMLNIRSLASTSHVAPSWLLNHAEMSRVPWRRGTVEGEIVVEMNQVPSL